MSQRKSKQQFSYLLSVYLSFPALSTLGRLFWCSAIFWFFISGDFCQSVVFHPGNMLISVASPSSCPSNHVLWLAFFPNSVATFDSLYHF